MVNKDLAITCIRAWQKAEAKGRIVEVENVAGEEAARWFSFGMGVQSLLESQAQDKIEEVLNGN